MTDLNFSNIAIICPTKNQPQKVKRLLNCLQKLKDKPGQIIIADGGHNLKELVLSFKKDLPIECVFCPQPGQVLQRSFAHKQLTDQIKLVIHLDDDITFESNFLKKVLENWNREANVTGKNLAGMSFNLLDSPKIKPSVLHKLFFLNTDCPGSVSKAGYASPFVPADTSSDVDWLLGGATAWSKEIIQSYPHPIDFSTRWAVCEDLIYSFPLRERYRLFVASDVICHHNESYSHIDLKQGAFYGKAGVIMRYFFVSQNHDLKFFAFLWMTLGIILANLFKALTLKRRNAGLFYGGVIGLFLVICNYVSGRDAKSLAKFLF